jgi:hypothetical protein
VRPELRTQLDRYEARRSCLAGRILIHSDPLCQRSGFIEDVETNFNAARNFENELDCLMDLEFGQMLVGAALGGKADGPSLYNRGLISLHLATTRNALRLRAEALRALAEAQAMQAAVVQKAQRSKAST